MKVFFVRGLSALLPTVLTLWILTAMVGFLGEYVARPITDGIHWVLTTNRWGRSVLESATPVRLYEEPIFDPSKLPKGVDPERTLSYLRDGQGFFLDLSVLDREELEKALDRHIPPIFGFVTGLVLIFLLGVLARGWIGNWLFRKGERIFFSFPLVRSIYPYAKQIVEFFFQKEDTKKTFHSVVAIPYPSKGMYTIGFVTSEGLPQLDREVEGDYVSIFVPSSPTPMTGYLVFVPREDVVHLPISVDQAMGLVVSGGVITPGQALPGLPRRIRKKDAGPELEEVPAPLEVGQREALHVGLGRGGPEGQDRGPSP